MKLSLKQISVIFYSYQVKIEFFRHEPEYWDVMVSVQFTNKLQYFLESLSFGKPWIMTDFIQHIQDKVQLLDEIKMKSLVLMVETQKDKHNNSETKIYWKS